ncbi:MAG: DUF5667 domain-containing protein [Candidatus Aenigmatarchaeota archaeon]
MKNRALIAIAISAVLIASIVEAEELPKPGILPDHPFYPVKTFLERARLWLTFDPEARARFHTFLAEQRLAELNAIITQGKWQYVERLRYEYERELGKADDETGRTFGLGKNATTLLEHVCNMTYKHTAVIERVLSKAPEVAKPGLEKAINASIKGHERCLERVEELINRVNEGLGTISCSSDEDCKGLNVWCHLKLGKELRCFIPENGTTGICMCLPIWNRTRMNCTDDSECRSLICPMVLGNDTEVCLNGICTCGAKWHLRNRTEWRERFGEDFSNITQAIQERIRERVEAETRRKG